MQSYDYKRQKSDLFSDDGQRMFLRVSDFVKGALKMAGAVRMNEAMNAAGARDSWTIFACVDRLVELGEIVEITKDVPGQFRVFVDSK